jgi:hypothetical protein
MGSQTWGQLIGFPVFSIEIMVASTELFLLLDQCTTDRRKVVENSVENYAENSAEMDCAEKEPVLRC